MAVYFKCPNCGNYFIDMYGENAADDTEACYMYGPYLCPKCGKEADSITSLEYETKIDLSL